MTVSGVVKSVNAEFASGRVNKRAKASGLYLIYLEANSLVNARQVSDVRWCGARSKPRRGFRIFSTGRGSSLFAIRRLTQSGVKNALWLRSIFG